jgi:SAM-dependent methyltransferase
MTETPSTYHRLKRVAVPIQERAFSMGNIIGINGYRANRILLKQRFAEGGYEFRETPRFLLCTRAEAPTTILVHWFAPEEIDADIGHIFVEELQPLGFLVNAQNFGDIFGAVVCSLFPSDPQRALRLYATNTLRRYRDLLNIGNDASRPDSTIAAFAHVYRRVFELRVGESFLDAGCSFGFLPLLIAERFPALSHIVGIDIQTDSFPLVRRLGESQLANVQFTQADLLADDFGLLGTFDTVVALHILEHFNEAEMHRVLANLLRVTSCRLIIAVPYEPGIPEQAYGHMQLFTPEKIEAVGQWCIEHLAGNSRMWYEECAGGLLMIERKQEAGSSEPAS